MGFFDKIKRGLKKTSDAVSESIGDVMAAFVKVDEDLLEELEEAMILADLGASTASRAVDELRDRAKHQHINTKEELRDVLCDILSEMMQEDSALDISKKPAVILVIGVNGVGKTTTIGKLASIVTRRRACASCCPRRTRSARLRRISWKSGRSAPVRTLCATAKVQIRPLLCLILSRRQKRAIAM